MKSPPPCSLHPSPQPCFICATFTRRLRSISRIDTAPDTVTDSVPICIECDDDWTFAVHLTLTLTRRRRKN